MLLWLLWFSFNMHPQVGSYHLLPNFVTFFKSLAISYAIFSLFCEIYVPMLVY